MESSRTVPSLFCDIMFPRRCLPAGQTFYQIIEDTHTVRGIVARESAVEITTVSTA